MLSIDLAIENGRNSMETQDGDRFQSTHIDRAFEAFFC